MARNKLTDLNNHLFEMLERLNDDELMEEKAEEEIRRADAVTKVGKTIIDNGRLILDAQKHADDYGYGSQERSMPDLLTSKEGVSNESTQGLFQGTNSVHFGEL